MEQILLIEDDTDICEIIRNYFAEKGISVRAVHNGADAAALIDGGISQYALVLLDIMLPAVDGFSLCKQIRRQSDIPVIFITAIGREEDILSGYDLGCDRHFFKELCPLCRVKVEQLGLISVMFVEKQRIAVKMLIVTYHHIHI